MWLATTTGFFSIVQHWDAPDTFLVRARVRQDLLALKEIAALTGEVKDSPTADYPHRLAVSRAELGSIMAALASCVDYPNFKDRIAELPDQRPKLSAYHQVWSLLRRPFAQV